MWKRIKREQAEYLENQIQGVTVKFNENNPGEFYFTIQGPKGTPYYGSQFNYKLTLPDNYPFKAPQITSLQKVYHYQHYDHLINGCNDCSPEFFKSRQSKWTPHSSKFSHYLEFIQQCFYEDFFVRIDSCTQEAMLYKKNKHQFIYNIKSTIAQEQAKEQFKQYLVFQKYVKQILSVNPDQVFIDLYF